MPSSGQAFALLSGDGQPAGRAEPSLVSVVVPVLNGEDSITDCIVSLLRTDYPAERREILIVDNGSTDRTEALIRDQPVRYLREERQGVARARNAGIAASRGQVLAFTDSDCTVTTGWLRQIVATLADPAVGGVAGEVFPFPPRTAAERYAARLRHLSPQRYLNRPIMPFAVTANLSFRREVFDRVGMFDTDSPRGGESTDFCTRFLRTTGQELRFCPAAAVFHRHRSSAWELMRQQWGYGRGHAYLYGKYGDEIPWTWSHSAQVYADLARSAGSLALTGLGRAAGRRQADELEFASFELLRKVALRGGFVRQSLAQGRLRL